MKNPTPIQTRATLVLAAFSVALLGGCSSGATEPLSSGGGQSPEGSQSATAAPVDLELANPGVLTVALQPSDPPSSFLDGNDNPTGYNVDIIKEIAKDLGVPVEWKAADYAVHIPNIANGTWDTATQGALVTEERLKQVDFSTPVDFAQARLVSPEGAPLGTWQGAAGKRIGVHTDALEAAANENIPDVSIVKFQDNVGMLNALRSEQIDGFVLGQNNAFNLIKENEGLSLSDPIVTGSVAVPLPKGNTVLLKQFNETLARLASDGTLASLHEQYYPGVELPPELIAAYPSFRK